MRSLNYLWLHNHSAQSHAWPMGVHAYISGIKIMGFPTFLEEFVVNTVSCGCGHTKMGGSASDPRS